MTARKTARKTTKKAAKKTTRKAAKKAAKRAVLSGICESENDQGDVGRFKIKLKPDGQPTLPRRLLLKIEVGGAGLEGDVRLEGEQSGSEIPVRDVSCRPAPTSGESILSFYVKMLRNNVVTEFLIAGGVRRATHKRFLGTYTRQNTTASGQALAIDPGDTGTGGGSTT